MTNRAVLYARVSGDDTGKDNRNLIGQVELCREFALKNGFKIVAELSEDDRGASGASWDLPKLNEALDMAQAGKFDALIVREMDRFARSLAKQLVIEEQFKRAGVNVLYVLEEYKDTPEGRLSKHIRATIAEYEREKIRERTTRAMRRKVELGSVMLHGGGAPYGYIRIDKDRRVTLEINEDEARIIRLIFDWYVKERLSIRAIARRLTEMGIPTPADKTGKTNPKKRAEGHWSTTGVFHILKREAYAGIWQYGKYNNFTNTTNPPEHLIPVTVPAIVSRETWELAQAQGTQNKAHSTGNTRHEYLLRSLVKCGHCGATTSAMAVNKAHKPLYLYYQCNAARLRDDYCHVCNLPKFRADKVDAVVWQWVREFIGNPQAIREGVDLYKSNREELTRPLQEQLTVTNQLIGQSRNRLEKLLDLYLSGDMMRDMLMDKKNQLEERIKALEAEQGRITQTLEAGMLTDEQLFNLETFASRIGQGLELADERFDARRQIIETLGIEGKIIMENDEQFIDITCHFGQKARLNVSHTRPDP